MLHTAESETVMKKIIILATLAMFAIGCEEKINSNNTLNNTNNEQEICSDNVDNDLDGAFDCADPDCIGNAACTTADCGNGLIDPDEECDGTDLNGQSCEGLNLGQGTLVCAQCAFDTRGCGQSVLKIYQSGTRMKMRVGTSPDGSKDFRGWYDSQLEINCVFRKMYTGLTRCIPEETSLNDRWYSDAACTVRHAAFPKEDEARDPFTIISMELSTGTFGVFQITGSVTGYLYSNSSGTCTGWPRPAEYLSVYSVVQMDASGYQGQVETVE